MTSAHQSGWTLLGTVMAIAIVGILSAIALPRLSDYARDSKIATLQGITGSIKATIAIVRSKALVAGLSRSNSSPGANASDYIVTTDAGSSEVDYRNLCPESIGESGDQLEMLDFLEISDDFETRVNN